MVSEADLYDNSDDDDVDGLPINDEMRKDEDERRRPAAAEAAAVAAASIKHCR